MFHLPSSGSGKRGLLEKGSFQKSPFSRDSREFRDSRIFREPPDSGKQRRIRSFSRDSRESRDFRDSRDFSSEKTPFVMTPFSGPDFLEDQGFYGKIYASLGFHLFWCTPWLPASGYHTVELRPEPPFTGPGVSRPSGPEIAKKVSKGSFWGSGEKSQNIPEKVSKYRKNTQKGPKIGIFRLFRVFFETFLQTPQKTLFETFFAISGLEGPETPVNGGSGRNRRTQGVQQNSVGLKISELAWR